MSTGSKLNTWYTEQVTPLVIPATPEWTKFPLNSSGLELTRDSIQSERLGSRHIEHFRLGNKQAGGSNDFEFSYGDFDVFLESLFQSAWDADTPSVGTDQLKFGNTRKYFAFAEEYSDMTGADKFLYFLGMQTNEFSLSISPNSMVTGSIGFVGFADRDDNTEVAGSTYPATVTNEPFTGFDVASLTIDSAPSTAVTQLDLSFSNNMQANYALGSEVAASVTEGKFQVSGTLTTFFKNLTLYKKYQNESAVSLSFTITDPAGNSYKFTLSNVKLTGGDPNASDDGEITLAQEFTALFDPTDASECMIERTPA